MAQGQPCVMPPTSSRVSICTLLLLGLLFVAVLVFLCRKRQTPHGAAAPPIASAAARPFNEVPTRAPPAAPAPQPVVPPPSAPTVPLAVGAAQGPAVGPAQVASGLAMGASFGADLFQNSPETAEFYAHFKPQSLESTMPAGWRSADDPAEQDPTYAEFSRYAVTPSQMKRAENMRSVLRLSESSRDGLSRTLGQRSLLRDFVTPLGPSPIGNNAMLFNDSSVRQNFIASATGRFPNLAESC